MKIIIYVWSIDDEDVNFKLIKVIFNIKKIIDIIVDDGFLYIFIYFKYGWIFLVCKNL